MDWIVCQIFTWRFFALLAVNKMMIIFVYLLNGKKSNLIIWSGIVNGSVLLVLLY